MKTLLVADVHANLAALEAVLDAESHWDRFVFRVMQERGEGVIDQAYIDERKETWRTAALPERYGIRDYAPLRQQGFR